jgi:hypothetical protein
MLEGWGEYVSTCEGVIWHLGEVRHYRGGWGGVETSCAIPSSALCEMVLYM